MAMEVVYVIKHLIQKQFFVGIGYIGILVV